LVASEKNVDACVVSMFRANVYDDWKLSPCSQRRRISSSSALYHELPSLFFNSIVENAVFGRGAPAGKKSVPSASRCGVGMFTSALRHKWIPRDPAYPAVMTTSRKTSRCTLRFHTCT